MRGLIYSSIAAAVLVTISGSALATGGNQHHYQNHKQKGALTVVDNSQGSYGNVVKNGFYKNEAGISGSFNGASGNIGANSAAGDNNVQGNSAALAAYDQSLIFGETSIALVDSSQSTAGNKTFNYAHKNSANLNGSFNGASGNVAANVAAGNNNIQANTMSAVVTTGDQAIAAVNNVQTTAGNLTFNSSDVVEKPSGTATITTSTKSSSSYKLDKSAAGGFIAGGFTAGAAVVAAGGVVAVPPVVIAAGGAAGIAYAAVGVVGGGFKTKYSEMGSQEMEEVCSTTYPIMTNHIVHQGENIANIGAGSFNGASGNIGVNMAAGSNNLQANHMSLAVSY